MSTENELLRKEPIVNDDENLQTEPEVETDENEETESDEANFDPADDEDTGGSLPGHKPRG